jgi:predicted cupin superfamily sugar epimerase
VPQLAVRGGTWQAARIAPGGERGWALLGCSLAPAWDETEFELANAAALLPLFPRDAEWVRELAR